MVFPVAPIGQGFQAECNETVAPIRPLKVLVVDDEPLARQVLAAILAADGHTVETESDPREALAKASHGTFDLVISDRAMPYLSGDRLARELARLAPGLPVLILTGTAVEELRHRASFTAGRPPHVLTKPLRRGELHHVLFELGFGLSP